LCRNPKKWRREKNASEEHPGGNRKEKKASWDCGSAASEHWNDLNFGIVLTGSPPRSTARVGKPGMALTDQNGGGRKKESTRWVQKKEKKKKRTQHVKQKKSPPPRVGRKLNVDNKA